MSKTATPPSVKLGKKTAPSIKENVEALKETAGKIEKAMPKATPKEKKVLEATVKVIDKAVAKAEPKAKAAAKPDTKAPGSKSSSVEAALARIKKSAEKSLAVQSSDKAAPAEAVASEEKAPYLPTKAKRDEMAHLLPAAMVKKAPKAPVRTSAPAAGKMTLAQVRERMTASQPAPVIPIFNARAHLKK